LPIDCDQCEIIEEIYQENIRAGDRDALHSARRNTRYRFSAPAHRWSSFRFGAGIVDFTSSFTKSSTFR